MSPQQRARFDLERQVALAKIIPARQAQLRVARNWLKDLWSGSNTFDEHVRKFRRRATASWLKGQSVESFIVENGLFAQQQFDMLGKAIAMALTIEFLES